MSGYTRLTEEFGDEAAATRAGRFAGLVAELSAAFAGRLVKLLGDGAMTHFRDGDAAVRFALELVDRPRGRGFQRVASASTRARSCDATATTSAASPRCRPRHQLRAAA